MQLSVAVYFYPICYRCCLLYPALPLWGPFASWWSAAFGSSFSKGWEVANSLCLKRSLFLLLLYYSLAGYGILDWQLLLEIYLLTSGISCCWWQAIRLSFPCRSLLFLVTLKIFSLSPVFCGFIIFLSSYSFNFQALGSLLNLSHSAFQSVFHVQLPLYMLSLSVLYNGWISQYLPIHLVCLLTMLCLEFILSTECISKTLFFHFQSYFFPYYLFS